MKQYEITFITKEDLKEKPVKEVLNSLEGKILSVSSIGEKQFTYPIKKETRGIYTTVVFELDSQKIPELNKKLALEEEILRHLVINSKQDQTLAPEIEKPKKESVVKPEPVEEAQKEEKPEVEKAEVKEAPKKPEKEKEKVKVSKKTVSEKPKAKVKETPKKSKVTEEIDKESMDEEGRLKALDKKLDELLKE